MTIGPLGPILTELGSLLEVANLEPDDMGACLLTYPNGVQVQIEKVPDEDYLLLGSELGEVPVGAYRQNVLFEALKANGTPFPRNGTLAFSTQTDSLVLFDYLPLDGLSGSQVATFLEPFVEKALAWKEALEQGTIPIQERTGGEGPGAGGVFGMKL